MKKPSTSQGNRASKSKVTAVETGGNLQEAKRAFMLGKQHFYGKNHTQKSAEVAFTYFSEAINKNPHYAEAYQYRGKCYQALHDYQRALYDFTMAIREDDKQGDLKKQAEHYNLAGSCHLELNQLDEALKHFEIAVKKDPHNGLYLNNRAIVKSRLDKLEEAIADYSKVIDMDSADQELKFKCYFHRGICLRKLGRLQESIKDLKDSLAIRPESDSALNNLGLSHFENEDFEEALICFEKAIQQKPHSFHYNNKGLANYHLGQLDMAKKDYDEAIQRQPEDPFYYYNRGNVFLNREEFDLAHEDYDTAIRKSPNNPKFWHSKGLAYQGLGDKLTNKKEKQECFFKAVKSYQTALEISEHYITSRYHLGLMFHKTLNFQEALRCFSLVLEKIPDDMTVYIARGDVYQDMGNHQFATNDFSKAIELNDQSAEAYFKRGLSLLAQRQFKDAIDDFKKSFELDEVENPGVFDGQGCCFHALGDYDQAINYFNLAISQDNQNIRFQMNRAQCLFDMGQYPEAITDLEAALAVDSENPQVLYKLGISYFAFEKYKRAIKTFKIALKMEPHMTYLPDIFYHAGLSYCRIEKFEKSVFPFSKVSFVVQMQAIECIPSDIRYIHERAKSYQMINYHEKAIEDFSSVIKRNPKNAHAYFRRAFSFKAMRKYDMTAEDFEKAKSLDPLNAQLVVNYKQLKGVTTIVLCRPGEEKVY